jgi:hypothetical protein
MIRKWLAFPVSFLLYNLGELSYRLKWLGLYDL